MRRRLWRNRGAWSLCRTSQRRSPIVDVEHTVLFDQGTMRHLFEHCGLRVQRVFSVRNTYPLHYWAKMAPLPAPLKEGVRSVLERSRLGRVPVTLKAGNLGTYQAEIKAAQDAVDTAARLAGTTSSPSGTPTPGATPSASASPSP